jgi:hypothetical protein
MIQENEAKNTDITTQIEEDSAKSCAIKPINLDKLFECWISNYFETEILF